MDVNQSTFCGWLAVIISFQIWSEFRLLGLLYVALLLLFSFSFSHPAFPPCVLFGVYYTAALVRPVYQPGCAN